MVDERGAIPVGPHPVRLALNKVHSAPFLQKRLALAHDLIVEPLLTDEPRSVLRGHAAKQLFVARLVVLDLLKRLQALVVAVVQALEHVVRSARLSEAHLREGRHDPRLHQRRPLGPLPLRVVEPADPRLDRVTALGVRLRLRPVGNRRPALEGLRRRPAVPIGFIRLEPFVLRHGIDTPDGARVAIGVVRPHAHQTSQQHAQGLHLIPDEKKLNFKQRLRRKESSPPAWH
mmetsp:Transcript_1945/g.8609  ORF Transcript_1945/g.8609 Transcript_1945/m.8609 type:complete len:231 (+) Transcript_1945:1392-2084(+)